MLAQYGAMGERDRPQSQAALVDSMEGDRSPSPIVTHRNQAQPIDPISPQSLQLESPAHAARARNQASASDSETNSCWDSAMKILALVAKTDPFDPLIA